MGSNLTRAERWAKTVEQTKPPKLTFYDGPGFIMFDVTELGRLRVTANGIATLAPGDTETLVEWINGFFA